MSALRRRPSGDRRLLLALGMVAVAITAELAFHHGHGAGSERSAVHQRGAAIGGEPREVDVDRVRQLILEGRLSNQEAEHYRPLAAPAGSAPNAEPHR